MGVDTKGYLRAIVAASDVYNVIATKFDKDAVMEIRIDSYNNKEIGNIYFKYKGEDRKIFYCVSETEEGSNHMNMFDGEKEYVVLIFGHWGNSVYIMTEIIKEFGGYVDENDCDDEEAIHIKQDGNFSFYDYVLERENIEKVLDKSLSDGLKRQIASQLLKHKESLKNLL